MRTIDLRSDTITLPTPQMREAMFRADLGDDVYGEDPSVNRLEEYCAKLLQKEDALFVSSGTMGNLIALLTHCQRGEQAIVGDKSHIAIWEQSGSSTFGGISLKTIKNKDDGTFNLDELERAINPENIHLARTKMIGLENTWNGNPLTVGYIKAVKKIASKHGLKLHLDGARLFNAAIATGCEPVELVRDLDSIQFCFSKGLAAPVGSMLCGSKPFISESRRMRKALGGGTRQAGVLAAACQVGLETMIERLAEDHENAKVLAEGLSQIPALKVLPCKNRTNMVFFHSADGAVSNAQLSERLKESQILAGVYDFELGVRAVTHYGISGEDIKEVIERVTMIFKTPTLLSAKNLADNRSTLPKSK